MEDLGYFDEARDGYGGDEKFKQDTDRGSFRPGTDVPTVKKFGRIFKSTPHGIGDHANRTQSRVSTIVGNDPGAPRSEKMATQIKMVKGKDGTWKKVRVQAEELDAYDIVLMHLIDEGYASHPDAAEAIMSNMSEEWIEGIMEGYKPMTKKRIKGIETQIDRKVDKQREIRKTSTLPYGQLPPEHADLDRQIGTMRQVSDDMSGFTKPKRNRVYSAARSKAMERANRERGEAKRNT
jgi:hypothetical protein